MNALLLFELCTNVFISMTVPFISLDLILYTRSFQHISDSIFTHTSFVN